MRQTSFIPFALLSLHIDGIKSNEESEKLILRGRGFNAFKPLTFVDTGGVRKTRVWLIPISEEDQKDDLIQLAIDYDQTTVLFSDIDRTTQVLVIKDNEYKDVGVLTKVDSSYAKSHGVYIYDDTTQQYWSLVR